MKKLFLSVMLTILSFNANGTTSVPDFMESLSSKEGEFVNLTLFKNQKGIVKISNDNLYIKAFPSFKNQFGLTCRMVEVVKEDKYIETTACKDQLYWVLEV
jgi:hypothetical protein